VAIGESDRAAKEAVAREAQLNPAKIPARAVAVLPFTVASGDTLLGQLGFALGDLLATDLARSSDLDMVERMHVEAMMRELDLVELGVTDPRGAPRVGRLVGARRILIGDLASAPGGDVLLSARVVDVIAGTVQNAVSARAPLDRILDAEKALAIRVIAELGATVTPAQRAQIEQHQSVQLAALVAYGRGVKAEAHGDAAGAASGFEDAARLDAGFAAARAQLASGPAAQRTSGVERVLALTSQAINQPVTTRLPEAADVPVASTIITLILTLRVF
jgi:TolB-like protein